MGRMRATRGKGVGEVEGKGSGQEGVGDLEGD